MFRPHCDKRLTPDHHRLSRGIFPFSGLRALFAPKPEMWPNPLIAENLGPGWCPQWCPTEPAAERLYNLQYFGLLRQTPLNPDSFRNFTSKWWEAKS
jgi:hypothetical protein